MTVELTRGNILEADAEALVNTVNCVGVMGKGIALQFKNAYPENFLIYEKACRHSELAPGKMLTVETGKLYPKYIINFPTKRHWKGKSQLEDVELGLTALVNEVRRLGIKSLAVPPLGCGNGGLQWHVVAPRIKSALSRVPDVHVLLFEPIGAPEAESMPIATAKPNMTRARALLLRLIKQYLTHGYRLSLLEIQKLAYFIQAAGEDLQLDFGPYKFGPYAEKLNYLLQRLEGHYLRGYGDRSRQASIRLLMNQFDMTEPLYDELAKARMERVKRLIEGFETPYGMELLATVHWVTRQEPSAAIDLTRAIEEVHKWSVRKSNLFTPNHIRKAWERLRDQEWLPSDAPIVRKKSYAR